MIMKFFYKNEIHRCSEVPKSFVVMKSEYLPNLFSKNLPQNFKLVYSKNENEKLEINTEEDFQNLLASNPSGTVKVEIVELPSEPVQDDDFEIIKNASEEKKLDDDIVTEKVVKEVVEAQLLENYPYFKHQTEEEMKKLISDAIQEQMPNIMMKIKEMIISDAVEENHSKKKEEEKQPVNLNSENLIEEPAQNIGKPRKNSKDNIKEFKEKLQAFAQKIKHQFAEFPDKAKELLSNVSNKLNPDPIMECSEGRYKKSVIAKANKLHEVFPEESLKVLLDLIAELPGELYLEQVVEVYLAKQTLKN